jgi:hypothetical protein
LEAGLEEGQEAGSDEGEIPDWLAELRPPVAEEEPSLEAGLEEGQEAGLDEEEIPDWLAEGEEEEEEAGLEAGSDEGEISDWLVRSEEDWEREGDSLRHAEIPAWLLALKPQELREKDEEAPPEPAVAEEPVEETGLLAGLQGILPVEMLIARPRSVGPAEPPAVVTDTPQARLFAEIVGKPPEAATTTVLQPRKGLLAKLPLLILYIVLIGAVALPQLLTETLVPRVVEATPAVTSLHDAIESLDSGAPVLVAFDYDPTTSGEMDVVAETIIRHLMERQARVVVVSLLPAGPATAESVLEGLVADGYANLGYIPGQAAAIRLLGQSVDRARPRDFYGVPLSDLAVMEGLINIQSFELLVELAPDQDTLRWWIEQGAMPSGVPLVAGVSASVEPLARAYYETEARQLVGMIGGVPGAAAYDALRGGSDSLNGTLGTRMDSQLAGHLVFVVVLLIGNGVYVVRRLSGRGR